MSTRSTLTRNTVFNAAGRSWEALAGLVLTAYILRRVDLDLWGAWALVATFTGYVALLDLGVGSGFAKYIAQHAARREHDETSAVVSTGFFFYLCLGALLVLVGWPAVDGLINLCSTVARWFSSGEDAVGRDGGVVVELRFLFRWALVLFAASNCVAAFTAIQTGLQRMGVTNAISFVASLVKIGATVFFLETGHGIRGILYAEGTALAVFGLASIRAAYVLEPRLRVSPRRITKEAWRKLFAFGWRAQVAKLSNLIMFQTDAAVVLVVFCSLGLVAMYDLGLRLANKMRQGPALVLSALLPAAADLDAREKHEQLARLYLRTSKYTAAVAVPLGLFCAGAAGLLMRTWLGDGFELAVWVLRIIAVGYVANLIPGAGVSIALGMGRPDLQMKAGLIASVSNIVLTIALVLVFGFLGVPIATALSMFLAWAWFTRAMGPVMDVRPARFLKTAVLWPVVASLPGFAFVAACDWACQGVAGRMANGAVLVATMALFAVAYFAMIALAPFLDAFDVEFMEDTLGLGRLPGFRLWTRRARRV